MHHIFLFRRDLRLHDNLALNALAHKCGSKDLITPIFIFNPKQINPQKNPYYGHHTVQFMIESLLDLHESCPGLTFLYGEDIAVLEAIHAHTQIQTLAFNEDITPFARARDERLFKWCATKGIHVLTSNGNGNDYTLIEPKAMEKPYQVFTPFYKKYLKSVKVGEPAHLPRSTRFATRPMSLSGKTVPVSKLMSQFCGAPTEELLVRGGRSLGSAILRDIRRGKFKDYERTRDAIADPEGTTKLSAYLKYGCVSVREVYHAALRAHGVTHALIRELFWRAFYDQVAWHFPHTLQGSSLRLKYDRIKWVNDRAHLDAWRTGRTGFPIVDAGIRQMLATGYMHNRVRMIVASFLVKDLLCDWRLGERFFAQHLTDYYPSANNGGWQWCSGSGADAQQYTRVFNPWIQAERHDPECIYIKRWIPELAHVSKEAILKWHTVASLYHDDTTISKYPAPIVVHAQQVKKMKTLYKRAL
jgi:deoxyribodipyrimidine photo-lyase